MWPAAHLPPKKGPEILTILPDVSLLCGVATGTSETFLINPADFEADAARHSHLRVASGTPVSSRHCHGLWGAALENVAPVVSRLRGELVVLPSITRSPTSCNFQPCQDRGPHAILLSDQNTTVPENASEEIGEDITDRLGCRQIRKKN